MPNKFANALIPALWLLFITQAIALTVDKALPDPVQESRAKALFYEIRCVVCQGEAIADSPADVASDMRQLIRERIVKGENDDDIKTYLVSRYGEVILMRPPLLSSTLLLWFGPVMILLFATGIAWQYFHRSRQSSSKDSAR